MLAPSAAATSNARSTEGYAGLPSRSTMVAPRKRPDTSMFHTTQLVEPTTKSRSCGWSTACNVSVFRCSRTTPPWPCTMPFGTPVVPEENSTQSGSLNDVGSAVHVAGWASASTQDDVDVPTGTSARASPAQTTWRTVSSEASTSPITVLRSTTLPL